MKNINFFSNGNCKNHGCEAIYLSLMKILGAKNYYAFSESFDDDKQIIGDKLKLINIYENSNKKLDTLIYKIKYKLSKNDKAFFDFKYKPFYKYLNKKNELFLSVGGDNYCYGYNYWLESLNNYVLKKQNKIILTGCSLEPDSLDEKMLEILNSFEAIVARESITYNALLQKKVKNVYLKPDPAFVLPTDEIDVSIDPFFQNEVIGLNISPLILKKEKQYSLILENVRNLINYIINQTPYNILFIPHVMIDGNDDFEVMEKLLNEYTNSNRMKIIKSDSATELKGYISKCKIMIAARTHASIAAYSNCIPTLVLGYSVKSKGIAKDIFGSIENYVIPIETIQNIETIKKGFIYINENYNSIKNHLNTFMPGYINETFGIRTIIEEYIDE